MRIHVVGAGAVGSFVAFHLRRTLAPKHSVVALHRKQSAPTVDQRDHGNAILLEADGITHVQDGVEHHHYTSWEDFQETRHILHPLKPPQQRRGDYELQLSRPDIAHGLSQVSGQFESLIVTTKAYAAPSVIQSLRDFISRDTTIVLLHNGMGVYEQLTRKIFEDPYNRPNFILCTNTHGLWRKDSMHVIQTGVGEIQMGIAPDPLGRDYEAALVNARHPSFADLSLDNIADLQDTSTLTPRYLNLRNTITALTGARALGAVWRPYKDVLTSMKRKLVVNAFINPISALLQCRNGDVLDSKHSHWILQRLCEEAEILFRAEVDKQFAASRRAYRHLLHAQENARAFAQEGAPADEQEPQPPIPEPLPRVLTRDALAEEVRRVVYQTRNNYSSMCMDVRMGQPTEIELINGYLRRISMRFHIPALVNDTLYQLINMRTTIPFVGKPT